MMVMCLLLALGKWTCSILYNIFDTLFTNLVQMKFSTSSTPSSIPILHSGESAVCTWEWGSLLPCLVCFRRAVEWWVDFLLFTTGSLRDHRDFQAAQKSVGEGRIWPCHHHRAPIFLGQFGKELCSTDSADLPFHHREEAETLKRTSRDITSSFFGGIAT